MIVQKAKIAVVGDLAVSPYSVTCDWKYENQEIVPLAIRKG